MRKWVGDVIDWFHIGTMALCAGYLALLIGAWLAA